MINVPEDLWAVLNNYISETGGRGFDDYIFRNRFGGPLSSRGIGEIVNKRARQAGISGKVRVHDLRHTAAMLRREAGADVEEIRTFLGHSSLLTTQVYLHRLKRSEDQRGRKVFKLITVEA
jgi:integrase